MKALARFWGFPEDRVIAIYCPGCEEKHWLYTGPKTVHSWTDQDGIVRSEPKASWGFNNDFEKPTFTPSLLVKTGRYAMSQAGYDKLNEETKRFYDEHSTICHSLIRDGEIQFLSDCTHKLAGQTIMLPEID